MSTAPNNVVQLRPRGDAATAPDRAGDPAALGSLTYTVKEVAEMLRLNLGGTYAMIRSGDIPARKLGGRWVIPRGRFNQWLDSCEEVSPAEAAANRRAEIGELSNAEKELIWRHRHGA